MLTIEELNSFKPDEIFDSGQGLIEHPWFNDARPISEGGNLEEDGRSTKVNWVAVKGGIDWAIYHSLDANFEHADYLDGCDHLSISNTSIARGGAKLHNRTKIMEFVPCTEEVLALYRD